MWQLYTFITKISIFYIYILQFISICVITTEFLYLSIAILRQTYYNQIVIGHRPEAFSQGCLYRSAADNPGRHIRPVCAPEMGIIYGGIQK